MEQPSQSSIGSTLTLGQIFLRIGAVAFGGIGAALALIDRELVASASG
jgi:chromate transport protein ChrA